MFLTHKKKSLPDLTHGFRDILSKLETNRQNSCLFLGSTSVFCVFAKSGGGEQKIIFSVFHNTCTLQSSKLILNMIWLFAHIARPNKKFFWMYFQNLGENPYVIDHFCKMSSCDASTMDTHPPRYRKNYKWALSGLNFTKIIKTISLGGGVTLSRIAESGSHSWKWETRQKCIYIHVSCDRSFS